MTNREVLEILKSLSDENLDKLFLIKDSSLDRRLITVDEVEECKSPVYVCDDIVIDGEDYSLLTAMHKHPDLFSDEDKVNLLRNLNLDYYYDVRSVKADEDIADLLKYATEEISVGQIYFI